MTTPNLLTIRRDGPVAYVTLNRPEVRNAFDDRLIAALTQWAEAAAVDPELRVAVLAGEGPVFSAGADLAWMSRMAGNSQEENVRDATAAATLFTRLDSLPCAVVGRVHGAALGGGCGLAAACDVVVTEEHAVFGFTEVKLGIIPATIAPCVLAKVGRSAARELFLTGMRFSAVRAREIGLVHAVVSADRLDATVDGYVQEFLSAAPGAIAAAKALIDWAWAEGPGAPGVVALTAEALASRRTSPEGREGMRTFLAKERPPWDISRRPGG